MNHSLRFAAATLALSLASLTAHAVEPGYVDLGKFTPAEGCEFVEVNLHSTVLKFASLFVGKDDADAAALIRSLKHVRVNVIGYNDTTRAEMTNKVESVRRELESQGWAQIVAVKHGGKQEDVAIYVKAHDEDAIDGLVITVIDSCKKEAVFVNLVGNIKPEQIAAIGRDLHIDPLSRITVTPRKGA